MSSLPLKKPLMEWQTVAAVAWSAVLLIITIRLLVAHDLSRHSVYPAYVGAAKNWVQGVAIYDPSHVDYRYSPLFAAVFTPFTLLPDRLGNILWRLTNALLHLTAAWLWWRTIKAQTLSSGGLFLLLLIPLSIGSLNNGQANPLMTSLALGALVAVRVQRWTLASALLAANVHLKLYPIAFALLLVLLYPGKLGWRFGLALALETGATFFLQTPTYVWNQFVSWFELLRGDLRLDQEPIEAYRDMRLLLHNLHVPISHSAYLILQLTCAALVAALCLYLRRKHVPESRLLALLYAAGISWILLLGPATESSTYILLAPALAWQLIVSWEEDRRKPVRVMLMVCSALLIVSLTSAWFPFVKKVHALGLYPLAVLVFLGCLAYEARLAVIGAVFADDPPRRRSLPQS